MEALTTLRYTSVFILLAKICVTVVVELECLRWSWISLIRRILHMYAGQNDACWRLIRRHCKVESSWRHAISFCNPPTSWFFRVAEDCCMPSTLPCSVFLYLVFGTVSSLHHFYTCIHDKQTSRHYIHKETQHNSTTPDEDFFLRKISCVRWDSNPRHSAL